MIARTLACAKMNRGHRASVQYTNQALESEVGVAAEAGMPPLNKDEPVVLEPGTEVSARFNGAFCEAKIRSLTPDVKLKVRPIPEGDVFVVKSPNIVTELKDLRVDGEASVRHPTTEATVQVIVLQATDSSTYIVDFNDGDEKKLKRSALLLKSGKHFDESISLDNLPLTQPEKMAASTSGTAEDAPSRKRSGRNDSIVSGETDDSSDVESVRRSVRQRRPVTYTASSNNGRKERLPKVDESDSSQSSLKDTASIDESTDLNAPSTSKAPEPEKAKEAEKPKEEAIRPIPVEKKSVEDKPAEIPAGIPPPVKRKVGRPPSNKSKAGKALAAEEANNKELTTLEKKEEKKVEPSVEIIPRAMSNTTLEVSPKVPSTEKAREKDEARVSPRRRMGDSETAPEVAPASSQPPPKETPKEPLQEAAKEEAIPSVPGTSSGTGESKGPTLQEEYPIKTVICVAQNGRKKCKWLPGVVVHPDARKKVKLADANELLIRLFSNSSYVKARRDQVKLFHEGLYTSAEEGDRVLRSDSALTFFRDQILPPTWSTTMFLPLEAPRESSEDGNEDAASTRADDDEEESEANRFLIQFIKWSDERGHPYDNAAMVEDKSVDMYKLYKAVHNAGGFNKCNQENKWEDIREELGFVVPGTSAPVLKEIYQKYLHGHGGFESIYRSLGSSVTDIRLGRKRYMTQESSNSVPPPDHFESLAHSPVPKKRPISPQQAGKKRRGRPPASTKTGLSVTPEGRLVLTVAEQPKSKKSKASTSDVPVEEGPAEGVASTSKVDRGISEESGDVVAAGDANWMAMRDKAVPDTPQITDPSVMKPGAIVSVLYRKVRKGQIPIAYPARIVDNVGNVAFYVHYEGWNKRYDEWVPLAAITGIVSLAEVGPSNLNSSQLSKIRAPLRRAEWSTYRPQLDKAMNLSPQSDHPMADTASTTSTTSEHPEAVPESILAVPSNKDVPSEEDKAKADSSQRKRSRSESTLAIPEVPKRSRVPSGTATQPTVEETTPEMKKSNSVGSRVADALPREKSPLKGIPEESTSVVTKSSAPAKEIEKTAGTSQKGLSLSGQPTEEGVKVRKTKSSKKKEKTDKGSVECLPEVQRSEQAEVVTKKAEVGGPKVEEKGEKDKLAVALPEEKPVEEEVGDNKKRKKSRSKKAEDIPKVLEEEVKSTVQSAPSTSRDVTGNTATAPTAGVDDGKQPVVEEEKYVSVLALDKPAKAKKARKTKEAIQETKAADTPTEVAPKAPPAPASESSLIRVEHHVRQNEVPEPTTSRPVPAPRKKKDKSLQSSATARETEKDAQAPPEVSLPKIGVEGVKPDDLEAGGNVGSKESVKEKRGSKGRPPKKGKKEAIVEAAVEVPLKAPHFASTHSAALERVGLPLDGSESGKETVMEEDEYGNFARMIVEGVDLTDPDVLHTGNATLTGAARIEAYEQCLNDTLLMSQLLIHRLATGYHILKRSEELQQDQQGTKKEDVVPTVPVPDVDSTDIKKTSPTASNASGRGRAAKSKV